MSELVIRFFAGGAIVSAFAMLGDIVRPKSFAGIFDAAPSVALATLALALVTEDAGYAALEARSMVAGAVALAVFSQLTAWLLVKHNWSSTAASIAALPVWLSIAFVLRALFLP